MPILRCYVTDETLAYLQAAARERCRGEAVEHLAEAAIADAAISSRKEHDNHCRLAAKNFTPSGVFLGTD